MQQQKRNAESNANKHFSRRNLNLNRGRPYIEYTRNEDENFISSATTPAQSDAGQAKRAVARKSTTARRNNDLIRASKPDPNRYLIDFT